jgi:hypothetical protein
MPKKTLRIGNSCTALSDGCFTTGFAYRTGNWSASPDVYVKYMIYKSLGYPGNLSSYEYVGVSTEL